MSHVNSVLLLYLDHIGLLCKSIQALYIWILLYIALFTHTNTFFVETTHLGGHIYNLSNNPSTVRHGVVVCLINSIIMNIKDVECSMKLSM